jgi:metal-dependent amidase/aminoacylase/carboxypeptidase family protein
MPENSKLSALGARLLSDAENISEEMQDWRRIFTSSPSLLSKKYHRLQDHQSPRIDRGHGGRLRFAIPTAVIGILQRPYRARYNAALLYGCDSRRGRDGTPLFLLLPGLMHGCGHDPIWLLCSAPQKYSPSTENKLKKRVVLLFQPAGEGRGGARTLVENRFLETFNIGSAASLHWWSELPYGELSSAGESSRPLSDKIHIVSEALPATRRTPHDSRSGTIASHIVIAIQTMLTREIDPREPVVVLSATSKQVSLIM